jgi:hypothetical protein
MTTVQPGRITRADIEAKLQEIRGTVETTKQGVIDKAKVGAVGAGVLVALLLYFLGHRGGKKQRTIVEIRRV